MLRVDVNDSCRRNGVDPERLADVVRGVLVGEGIVAGEVSVAVVDGPTMHALNRRHLAHDYPTDVLSFLLERRADTLEGEIVVSADEAALNAPKFGWLPEAELMLYVIHGALHLCGYDDLSEADAGAMREREAYWLTRLGVQTGEGGRLAVHPVAERQP